MGQAADIDGDIPAVDAEVAYLEPSSRINRRFWANGAEVNTGVYRPHPVKVRDARRAPEPLSLDTNGFVLLRHSSAVEDFRDPAQVNALYPGEMAKVVSALTGADLTAPTWAILRSAAAVPGGLVQPPAADVHVDFTASSAERYVRGLYERTEPGGPGYSRFAILGQWRAFTPPPQDWPLALCDARSVGPDEGVANTLVMVDALPEGEAAFAEIPGEDRMLAASVFVHNPAHRWWWFPNLTREELIVFKFYDSDHSRSWRTPHTGFHDRSAVGANTRESIEFRVVAYWR